MRPLRPKRDLGALRAEIEDLRADREALLAALLNAARVRAQHASVKH